MTEVDLVEYRRAQDIAFIAMGRERRMNTRTPPEWLAHVDPLAHHELTELIFAFRSREGQHKETEHEG